MAVIGLVIIFSAFLCQQRLHGLYLLVGAHSGEKDRQKDPQTEDSAVTRAKPGWACACLLPTLFLGTLEATLAAQREPRGLEAFFIIEVNYTMSSLRISIFNCFQLV